MKLVGLDLFIHYIYINCITLLIKMTYCKTLKLCFSSTITLCFLLYRFTESSKAIHQIGTAP